MLLRNQLGGDFISWSSMFTLLVSKVEDENLRVSKMAFWASSQNAIVSYPSQVTWSSEPCRCSAECCFYCVLLQMLLLDSINGWGMACTKHRLTFDLQWKLLKVIYLPEVGESGIKRQAKSENTCGDKMFLSKDQQSRMWPLTTWGHPLNFSRIMRLKGWVSSWHYVNSVGFRCLLFILARKS